MPTPTWNLEDVRGRINVGTFAAQVDVTAPQNGLDDLRLGQQAVADHFFAVEWTPADSHQTAPSEVYVRDTDLVAFYSPTETFPFRREIYWRWLDPSDSPSTVAVVDLLASIQTDLLDSRPAVCVSSSIAAVELLRMTSSRADEFESVPIAADSRIEAPPGDVRCLLLRLPQQNDGESFSYVEMVHPSDVGDLALVYSSEGRLEIKHTLMADFLEKGVIRRSRLRGVFLDRQGDTEAAARWYRSFISEQLPLTT